jgi:tetratricopeptide (TPR) repeat protein
MSDPIETLCTVLLDIAKTSPGANINDVMAQVKSALDRNTKLTNALQTDTRMLQINLGQSKGYQVLVEGNATAYIGDRYELDTDAVIKALGKLLDEIALNQNPVGIPQNLPRSGVVEFVGRDSKLIELHDLLQSNKRIAITAIAGMGGIGKTELALQYAIEQLQQGQYPAGICWLRARDREIATDIVNFAQVHLGLSLPDQLEIEDQVRFCWQRWLEGEALVVLDDVTDYQAIEPYLPPADPRFKLLITTRLDLGSTVQKVPLEELDENDAIALLESLVGAERVRSQLADAQVLCKWVGYLPLALELLGRFLARKLDWSIDQLLKALDEKRLTAKALVETENGMTGQLGVAAALELSWQELNEAEQELACVLGMFAIAPIPWSLVESCQSKVEPDDLEDTRDDGLMARSLLKRVGDGSYQLHQIVQEYFRIKLGERGHCGEFIKDGFWNTLLKNYTANDPPSRNQIEKFKDVIVHIEEGARKWLEILDNKDLGIPFLRIGRFYKSQCDYNSAETWYLASLTAMEKRPDLEHKYIAASMNNLAEIYLQKEQYEKAELLLRKAVGISERKQGDENENAILASSLGNLACSLRYQKRYHESELLNKRALKMFISVHGKNHHSVAISLDNLATLYGEQERCMESELLNIAALKMFVNIHGKIHQSVAFSLKKLANLYSRQKYFHKAEYYLLEALEILRLLHGDRHPLIASCKWDLGVIYQHQSRYTESEKLYDEALEDSEVRLGSNRIIWEEKRKNT